MRAPKRAMVLAAGLGLRMRPLTVTTPKPLLPVAGRCMLDRALDKLEEAGVVTPVVNYHHLGGQVVRHLQGRDVALSDETELLLETGGGVVKALPLLGTEPFFVINADILWEDGPTPALERLALAWDGATMDALLLVHPTAQAYGYEGPGDFFVAEDGRLERESAGVHRHELPWHSLRRREERQRYRYQHHQDDDENRRQPLRMDRALVVQAPAHAVGEPRGTVGQAVGAAHSIRHSVRAADAVGHTVGAT